MAIVKSLDIKIKDGEAKLSENFYVYQNDRGIELRLNLDVKKICGNTGVAKTHSKPFVFEGGEVFAGVTILKPNKTVTWKERIRVIDDIITFQIDKEMTDEIDELGIYRLQFHIYDGQDNRITIPPVSFEVRELIGHTGDNQLSIGRVDESRVDYCVVGEEGELEIFAEGRYIKTIWYTGDVITSQRLNKIETALESSHTRIDDVYIELNSKADEVHEHSVEEIPYTNASDDSISTLKDALDKLLYFDLGISLSSTSSTSVEMGATLEGVVFNWSYNKQVVSQVFNGTSLDKSIRTYTETTPFSNNRSFTLTANDGSKSFNKSISFSFLNGRYWGVSTDGSYTSDFVKKLNRELSSSRAKTFTVSCGEGQYIYYCIPTRFGTPTFAVGGFSGGFNKVATIQFTNASEHTENYDIWKSSNSDLGTTTVVVS